MKSVGIITMHKPISYGSALQAYALQKAVSMLGYDAQIIDYQYPNDLHMAGVNKFRLFIDNAISMCKHALFGFPNIRKKKRFEEFYKQFYHLSSFYPSEESLLKSPPIYDIYMTGSDQVWNVNFTKSDSSFLLGFAPDNKPKISYSSSFALSEIPIEYVELYKHLLRRYNQITVRESSAIELVKQMTGKETAQVCDPTLLLDMDDWNEIADTSSLKLNKPYILVFMLRYSFNPYPDARRIINGIQKELGLPIIFLNGIQADYFHKNASVIKSGGPADFINLVRNASYVITDSFHGAVFSTIYEKPLSAIVKRDHKDSRILNYLQKIGWEKSAVYYDSECFAINVQGNAKGLQDFKQESLTRLDEMLAAN